MMFIWNLYRDLAVKTRLYLLCICYSFCLIATGFTSQFGSPWIKYGSLSLFIVLGLVFGAINVLSIISPLEKANNYLLTMADGDLSVPISVKRNNEISRMLRSIGQLQQSMCGIIDSLQKTSIHLASSSDQLCTSSEEIAASVGKVAEQTSSVATAGEEMSATSNEIAHNCIMAAEAGRLAYESALEGETVVKETVVVMGQIADQVRTSAQTIEHLGEKSDQIGNIICTIEDIADQTNLLALNAAIEAARAGEQGRGFAVVADEVRALAERTTKATREISAMIKSIQSETQHAVAAMEQGVQQVEKGTDEASKSGQALVKILEHINSVSSQLSQIATAAEEQSATTSEISQNMNQMTEIMQTAARGGQDSATAAFELARLADDQRKLAGKFTLPA